MLQMLAAVTNNTLQIASTVGFSIQRMSNSILKIQCSLLNQQQPVNLPGERIEIPYTSLTWQPKDYMNRDKKNLSQGQAVLYLAQPFLNSFSISTIDASSNLSSL